MDYQEMTSAHANPTDLISELNALAATAASAEALMKGIVAILHGKLTRYNWVGFYMLEREADRDMLVLGPFQGTMTPHTRIPLNQGICGAAASTAKTIVVDDVAADARYLACSLETKSEIVVPVSSTVRLPANSTSTPIFSPPLVPTTASFANTPPLCSENSSRNPHNQVVDDLLGAWARAPSPLSAAKMRSPVPANLLPSPHICRLFRP